MARVKLLASLALLLSFFPVIVNAYVGSSPITCVTSFMELETIVDCLDKYTVTEDFYDADRYNAAQPSASEISAWNNAIQEMLTSGCSPGSPVPVTGLLEDYTVARITDLSSYSFCILSERNTYADFPVYRRGWGLVVTPADPVNGAIRDLHFSAPHPKSDENTPQQAAALFVRTKAKSLVITGRHRRAYAISSACVVLTPPDVYYKTDAAHDDNEPFYLALKQVAAWKDANGGCKWPCCAYLQMHGMANDTCPESIFMSSGRGNSLSSMSCYANTLLPIYRLKNQLISIFGPSGALISTPAVPASCDLTATRNIFGRLVSGIPASGVCSNTPTIPCTTGTTCPPGGCMGKFVHIEQDPEFRLATHYGDWANAINAAFVQRTQCPTQIVGENTFQIQS